MPAVARDLMTADPLTVPASMPFLQLQHLLVAVHVSGVPVVDPGGAVVGIVTAADLLRAADQALDEDRDAGESDDVGERFDALTAAELATPDVIWVSPDTPLPRIAQRMRAAGIHRVLVGEHGRLEGILTAYDLLQALA